MKSRSNSDPSTLDDDFLLTLVHDLRAYLRSSLTGAQLLQRSAGGPADGLARERIATIVSANKEMDKFLGRLADYAGAGHLGPGKAISLEGALHSSLLQFAGQPVELSPLPEEASLPVPREIVRVFTELIDNAYKFSKGHLVRIEVPAAGVGSSIAVRIIDSGIGISPADEELLAAPLTRLNAHGQYPGFGLGLPIARRIAAAANATVHLSPNATGKGATATVRFENR